MKALQRMVLFAFIRMFLLSLFFFLLIFQLVDIFSYIWRYINLEVPFIQILLVQAYYIPKCISFSISPSLLFAIAYTLGTMYANNELIAVFGSGVSLIRLVIPLMFVGFAMSAGSYFFEERVVIDTYRVKNTLSQDLLKQRKSLSNTQVTVIGKNNRLIYHAEYFNDSAKVLRGLIILERDSEGRITSRIDAEQAVWKQDHWEAQNVRIFSWDEDGRFLVEDDMTVFSKPGLDEDPSTFRKTLRNIGEMRSVEAKEWVENLRKAGLPYREPLTEYYKRFSFALTPLIVAFLSCALGGRFKKNILLMSLLLSLVVSVLFYVSQMISSLFAKSGLLSPLAGAWGPYIIFFISGLWLFKVARS
ncbi:MAG: permease [Spirochaetales bacterium]|nr:permease [Spirochaetales bacterium]